MLIHVLALFLTAGERILALIMPGRLPSFAVVPSVAQPSRYGP